MIRHMATTGEPLPLPEQAPSTGTSLTSSAAAENNGAANAQSNATAESYTLCMEHLGGFLPLLKVLYFIKSNTDDALFYITEVPYAFMLFFLLPTHCN